MRRLAVRVGGTVQGVGFRPFVHGVATRLGLAGHVGNDERGVLLEVEGPESDLEVLVAAVREGPPLAVVTGVECAPLPVRGERGFVIVASTGHDRTAATTIPPDTATCDDCLAELRDPTDRRHRHPFVNCTNCGPRLTIVTGVPYDRVATTMAAFEMCRACAAEYEDPGDRRFHAQPVCCPSCGPTLRYEPLHRPAPPEPAFHPTVPNERHLRAMSLPEGAVRSEVAAVAGVAGVAAVDAAAVDAAGDVLRAGAVLAVKGLGGYHLAVLAGDEDAVRTLRGRKHREDRSFAVAVPDLATARGLCHVDDEEAALLSSHRAPIVLVRRRAGAPVAESVAPGDPYLGLMLPYTPVHHLLLDAVGEPIVLTSGNVSDEPIAHRDDDAAERLAPIADGMLTHDRPIRTRADDSVLRVVRGRPYPVRRSRGYAPSPIPVPLATPRPVLGVGAELKNTFCLLRGDQAFVSHHIGDLANAETLRAFTDGVAHLSRLLDVVPEVVAHDVHPEYLSTKWALDLSDVECVGVQHHHAHLAGCLAEHGETGHAIGIACDGTGFGTDGTLWGGEIFDVSLAAFDRVAHLEPVPLPGGATAIREPWRTAAAWLWTLGEPMPPEWATIGALLDAHASGRLPQPVTTSAGRLFDAVAALCGVRDRITYEGQAAIELERLVAPRVRDGYPVPVAVAPPARDPGRPADRAGSAPVALPASELVRAVLCDLRAGVGVPVVAARFHIGLAAMLVDAATAAARARGRDTVALSGGVFANLVLLEAVRSGLEAEGLRVLVHSQVPCNDGGISLGQVAVAAAREDPDAHPGGRVIAGSR
ncbi:carbamoyltransferase HypF [Pseudonocardia endophytica]|uniref:Carbamoyltransferase n=1 Tax=Pseudonocardia endophytica TaxID=401976 RepID=A0A4R1HKB1_PSEEN|nr:carbamoyltransferase HypF [Pseudonocardia endophytica]TCK22318.1 hydrogenase maturation protein HypF [Pseudonocardia endophytica]